MMTHFPHALHYANLTSLGGGSAIRQVYMNVVRCRAGLSVTGCCRLVGLLLGLLLMLGSYLLPLSPDVVEAGILTAQRRYGPSTPSGYYVRLDPSVIKMSHNQNAKVTVTVEDDSGQPIDDVLVSYSASEGQMTSEPSYTQDGMVTATYTVAASNDAPRTAVVIVSVEDVQVTVFIDIVPAVFGR